MHNNIDKAFRNARKEYLQELANIEEKFRQEKKRDILYFSIWAFFIFVFVIVIVTQLILLKNL